MSKHYSRITNLCKAPCLFLALCLLICACSDKACKDYHRPVTHNDACDIWPDSIDLHNGVILRAFGDSMLQVRVEGNVLRRIRIPSADGADFAFKSDFAVIDALFRLESSLCDSTALRFLRPYEIYLNPLNGREGIRQLKGRLKNGYVVPFETSSYVWPVVNDNPSWILAACELFKVTGSRRWLETLGDVSANVMAADCRVARNSSSGLFLGLPRYLAADNVGMPRWMTPSDLFAVRSFGLNATYWCALNALNSITLEMARKNERSHLPEMPVDTDSLRHVINREFWLPNLGIYSAMLYGAPLSPVPVCGSDNLAQGLAVLSGMAGAHMGRSVMEKTPVMFTGVRMLTPAFEAGVDNYPVQPLAQAVWTAAAAQWGGNAAYEASLGGLLFSTACALLDSSSPMTPFRSSLAGVIVRGFLGMRFAFDGIFFTPSIPGGMPGEKLATGIRYRKSIIDISVTGTGKEIASFSIDGKNTDPFFPASLEGKHRIDIVMSDRITDGDVMADDGLTFLPAPPTVEWSSGRNATILPPDMGRQASSSAGVTNGASGRDGDVPVPYGNLVYLNGVLSDDMLSRRYTLYEAPEPTWVQMVSVCDNRYAGFSSKPHLYVPEGKQALIYLASVASGGTKVVQNKSLAARFVESDRQKNRNLKLEYEAEKEGDYLLDVHYLSGLGIVNPRRKMALRSLVVNGVRSGVFVFPQMSPKRWDRYMGDSWQTMAAYSNPLKVHLDKGRNVLELRYYQPTPVYVDPQSNAILADFLRIVRL